MSEYRDDTVNTETLTQALIKMATESWRFDKVVNRMLLKLDSNDQTRYINQCRWFSKKIEEALQDAGLRVVNIEGHPFEPGMAATPLNIDEFDPNDSLLVDQMLEPIIMNNDGLVKTGTILLKREE